VTAAASGALERIEALRGELLTLLEALGSRPPAELASAGELPAEPTAVADDAGARLVALELALNGTPREQAEAVLSEQFAIADRRGLLDDVYAAAGRT
jgi:hypothetical protein